MVLNFIARGFIVSADRDALSKALKAQSLWLVHTGVEDDGDKMSPSRAPMQSMATQSRRRQNVDASVDET